MLFCVGVKCTAAIHLFRGRGMVIDKTYFKPKTFCYLYSLLPTPPTTHIVSHLTQWHTLTFLGLICLEVVRSFELIKKWKAPWTKEVPCAKQINLYNYELTSPRPSPSPKSKPRIPKSQNQKGKGEFGLWAVTKLLRLPYPLALAPTHPQPLEGLGG